MSIETAVKQYLAGKAPRDDFEWENQMIAKNLPLDRNAHWTMLVRIYGAGACLARSQAASQSPMDLQRIGERGMRHQSSNTGSGKQVLRA